MSFNEGRHRNESMRSGMSSMSGMNSGQSSSDGVDTSKGSSSRRKKRPSLSSMGSRQKSLLGVASSPSNAPIWIRTLVPLSQEKLNAASSKLSVTSKCTICAAKLGSQIGGDRKVCKVCGRVTCRLCMTSIHLVGVVRRRYVCFHCVAKSARNLPPLDGDEQLSGSGGGGMVTANGALATAVDDGIDTDEEDDSEFDNENQGILSSLMDRVWDMWAQWMDADSDDQNPDGRNNESSSSQSGTEDGLKNGATDDEEPSYRRSRRLSQSIESSGGGPEFNGDEMEKVFRLAHNNPELKIVQAELFVQGCREIMTLMGKLGKGFGFASTDMNHKLEMMKIRIGETAKENGITTNKVSLQAMVERDIRNGTTHAGKKAAPASRIILRLMWFLDYVSLLLKRLSEQPEKDLKSIISSVYEETLGPRHPWVLRRIVRAGLGMVPDKKQFIPKLGFENIPQSEQQAKLMKWGTTLENVSKDLWDFMKSKQLDVLP